ncbi:Transposase IS4 [Popillia japonica]|uniref:Transposase IS4 n=1 Tax=Popillia japonica TaxID=7064 RepID=A0AAW1HUJ9_POPJA
MNTYVGLTDSEAEYLSELMTTVESDGSECDEELEDIDYDTSDSEYEDGVPGSSKRRKAKDSNIPHFSWRSDNEFVPQYHAYDSTNPGFRLLSDLEDENNFLQYFQCYFTEELVQEIATETNRYFEFVTQNTNKSKYSRLNHWRGTNTEEIFLFLGMTMLIAKNKKLKISECWSRGCLLQTPIFQKVMSRDSDIIIENKISSFMPFENLCIDESLLLYKGRLSFKQYIRSKRHRFGVKFFVLTDVETDYVLDFIIYTGAITDLEEVDKSLGISGAIVYTLMKPCLEKDHNIFPDNWYTSPTLAKYLHEHKTNLCGTVRNNRKGMPKLEKKLKQGEVITQHTDKIMALKWRDRRDVYMLTTLHTNKIVDTGKKNRQGEAIKKPECVKCYNQNMGSVDKIDMLLSSVECIRKTIKWYKKIFFHLLDLAVTNSYAMYNVKTGNRISLADFQLELIRQIIEKIFKDERPRKPGRPSGDVPIRLVGRHFPKLIPAVPGGKQNSQRICHVCKHTELGPKRRKDTSSEKVKCQEFIGNMPSTKKMIFLDPDVAFNFDNRAKYTDVPMAPFGGVCKICFQA